MSADIIPRCRGRLCLQICHIRSAIKCDRWECWSRLLSSLVKYLDVTARDSLSYSPLPPPFAYPCLVRRQPLDDSSHLLVGVYPEALVLCHARQLHILGIQLLLHNLLQRLENQSLGVDYGQGLDNEQSVHNPVAMAIYRELSLPCGTRSATRLGHPHYRFQ